MFSQNLLLRENDRWIVKASFSSNNQWGIIKLPLPLSKLYIIVRANLPGNLAAVYLLTILLISISKFEAIFLALCNSPIITLCLYLTWIFDVQSTGSFLILLYTWVVILLFLRITSLSRNMVNSILRSVFSFGGTSSMHGEVNQFHSVFFWHMYHPHDARVIFVSKFRFLKYK